MNVGQLSVWRIAKRVGVTPRWVREIYSRYLESGTPPELRACGRKPQPLSEEVKEQIKAEYAHLPNGAVLLEQRLRRKGVRASHNKIHVVLKEAKLAKRELKKSRKRKWVRYERHKANSLWHSDWKQLDDGKWMILFEDDATRLCVGYGIFDTLTAELSLQIFFLAVQNYGMPRQLLTDNGSTFCNTSDKQDMNHLFHGTIVRAGCDHIFTRKSHPQCNGKLEKLNDTIQKLYRHYHSNLQHSVKMYNEERLHMSLQWHTPLEAWTSKIEKGLKYQKPIKT